MPTAEQEFPVALHVDLGADRALVAERADQDGPVRLADRPHEFARIRSSGRPLAGAEAQRGLILWRCAHLASVTLLVMAEDTLVSVEPEQRGALDEREPRVTIWGRLVRSRDNAEFFPQCNVAPDVETTTTGKTAE